MNVQDLFADIHYTVDNPVIIKSEKVFKEDNKIKRLLNEKRYDLTSNDFLTEIRKCNKIDITFKQRGILRILREYDFTHLKSILGEVSQSDKKFVSMNKKTREKIFKSRLSFHNLIFCEDLSDDEIVIGDKVANCILNTETGEYYFNRSAITILYLR